MVLFYMVGSGLDSAACAIVGAKLGSNNVGSARTFYSTFRWLATMMIICVIIFQWIFKV